MLMRQPVLSQSAQPVLYKFASLPLHFRPTVGTSIDHSLNIVQCRSIPAPVLLHDTALQAVEPGLVIVPGVKSPIEGIVHCPCICALHSHSNMLFRFFLCQSSLLLCMALWPGREPLPLSDRSLQHRDSMLGWPAAVGSSPALSRLA